MADRQIHILSVSQAAEQLDSLVRLAGHGEEVAIARGGKVVARLVGASKSSTRGKDSLRGKLAKATQKRARVIRKTIQSRASRLSARRMSIVEKLLTLNEGNKASDAGIVSIIREGRQR
jgi:antitoxin (DNA-binding transcriptional repressor) of toxin-antitoxin stability system